MQEKDLSFKSISQYNLAICNYVQMQADCLLSSPQLAKDAEDENPISVMPKFLISKEQVATLEEQLYSFALKTNKAAKSGIFLPLYNLIHNRKLSKLQVHLVMVAFAWEYSPSFCDSLRKLVKNPSLSCMEINTALQLYRTHSSVTISSLFGKNMKEFFSVFFNSVKTLDRNTEIKLNPMALSYLIGKEYALPYFMYYKKNEKNHLPLHSSLKEEGASIYKNTSVDTVIVFTGKNGIGKKNCIKEMANLLEKEVLFVDSNKFFSLPKKEFEEHQNTIFSEAYLKVADLCFFNFSILPPQEQWREPIILNLMKQLQGYGIRTLLTSEELEYIGIIKDIDYIQIKVPMPTVDEQNRLWENHLKGYSLCNSFNLSELSAKFELTPKQIKNAAYEAKILSEGKIISSSVLQSCCYNQTLVNLSEIAQRIEPVFTWNDLVLPSSLKKGIKQSCNHIKLKNTVYNEWNFSQRFSYGTGVNILFAGAPGTGKTMVAQVIANELEMELYRIDLSAVVSKFIGETEKNLQKVFDEAKKSSVILFFDEMDSLFGKRSETQDAHDKYANMETAYLLQKIENYNGIVLMATNYLTNIDEAFIRRIHFIFSVPFPTEENRLLLWTQSFPKEADMGNDIDFGFLAHKFEISGAIIKNIALSGAFMAAADNLPISMKHLIKAAYLELSKQGKIMLKEDFGQYAYILEGVI
ncbi:MAG: AAA family ATPase [Lachnospiraceae bacterium]|nr:AAA family ATPase [Lachnospiraceae bacterium]